MFSIFANTMMIATRQEQHMTSARKPQHKDELKIDYTNRFAAPKRAEVEARQQRNPMSFFR